MRASVEKRKQAEAEKQERRAELLGMLYAGLFGLMIGGIFWLYTIIY